MAVQIRTWLNNFINTYIIPNGNNLITGQQANDILTPIVDSMIHRIDDKDLLNLREWKSTRTFEQGECCVYLGSIYQSSTNSNLNHQPDTTPAHWDKITDGNQVKYSFPPYDNSETYAVNDTCRYQDKLWRATAITQGNAPTSPSPYWIEVSASKGTFGEFHQVNTFYQAGTVVRYNQWLYVMMLPTYFSANFNSELSAGVWMPFPNIEQLTHVQLLAHIAGSRIAPGRIYYVTDKSVFLTGVTPTYVDPSGYYIAQNPDNNQVGNYLGFGIYKGVWSSGMTINDMEIVLYNGKYYRNLTDDAGSNPDTDSVNWTIVQKGKWRSTLIVNYNDVVIWNGMHYKNLVGGNFGNPTTNPADWQLVALGSPSYITEVDQCYFDVQSGTLLKRIDKRGNVIGSTSLVEYNYANAIAVFDWGNDKCYNNTCSSGLLHCYNNAGIIRGCKVSGRAIINSDLNDGTIEDVVANNYTNVLACKDSLKGLVNCRFESGEALTTYTDGVSIFQVFDKTLHQDNIRITTTHSNFRKVGLSKINIPVASTTIDLSNSSSYVPFCGMFEITSTGDLTINDIIGAVVISPKSEFIYRKIRINVVGINLTLVHGLIKCPGGVDLVINDGGFVVLKSIAIGSPSLQVEYYQNY